MFLRIKLNDEQLERAQNRLEQTKKELSRQHVLKGNLVSFNQHLYQGDFGLSLVGDEIHYSGSEYWFHEECFMKLVQIADYDSVLQARNDGLNRFQILESDFSSFNEPQKTEED